MAIAFKKDGVKVRDTVTQIVPIAQVVVDKGFNNRRQLGDLAELAASIKSFGLLNPILVRRENGSFHLIAGERRLAASKLAGKKEIEIKLVDEDEKTRLELLLVENLHRKDIDPLEEADGYQRLLKLDLKQSEIAKKVGRSEAHISKRLALKGLNSTATKLLAAGTLPIDAAVGLAKFDSKYQDKAIEHVKRMYTKLEDAAPYQLRNLADRARDEAKKEARSNKRRALTKKLKALGITVLSSQNSYHWGEPGHPWRLGQEGKSSYRSESRVNLTPKQHEDFPCHAAAVTSPGSIYDTAEPKVIYLCTDPKAHMTKEHAAALERRVKDGQRDSYEIQQQRRRELEQKLKEAREARLPAIRDQLKRLDAPTITTLALEVLVVSHPANDIVGLLGLPIKPKQRFENVLVEYCNASQANLLRAAAAVAVLKGERSLSSLAQGYYAEAPPALVLADWFAKAGIELTDIEKKAIAKKSKSGPVDGEDDE